MTVFYVPSGGGGGGSSVSPLARTAVKTANYSAAVNDLVACDPTGGAFTVTLPNAPANKSQVAVKVITATAPNAVSVTCAGSDVINRAGGATTKTLLIAGESALFQYDSATSIWTIAWGDTPVGSLDLRYSPTIAGAPGTNIGATASIAMVAQQEKWLTGTLNANLALTITLVAGGKAKLIALQDGTGSRTLTVNGTAVAIPTAAGAAMSVDFVSPDGTDLEVDVAGGSGTATPTGPAGGELAGTYPNPTVADLAVTPRRMSDFARLPWANASVITRTIDPSRVAVSGAAVVIVSGTLKLSGGATIPGGRTVTNIVCYSGSQVAATSTHCWFCLVDRNLNVVAKTVDDTAASPWSANTRKSLALSATYTPTNAIEVYIGVVVVATTVPNLAGIGAATTPYAQLAVSGYSTTGLTDPASLGGTAAALSQTSTTVAAAYAELT